MPDLVLMLSEPQAAAPLAGRTTADHLVAVLQGTGTVRIVAPTTRIEGAATIVDGRFGALRAEDLGPLLETDGVLLAPSGEVAAARQTFASTAAEALRTATAGVLGVLSPEAAATGPAVERVVRARHLADLEAAGVRVVDPSHTLVDPTVSVAPGATLWPGVVLRGATVVEAGAEIQAGCWVEDTRIEERALLKPYCVCSGARIGPGAAVGPFAHLRPAADLGPDTKVGNFVEVKKATLHAGAKASHLTYIGDAEIGPDANIGAGTITCNYDGYGKHRTTIGAGAFVGSNTALVAPVTVGEGAIIGAGSVVVRDVPAESVYVERATPRTLEGHAPRLRARNAKAAGKTP